MRGRTIRKRRERLTTERRSQSFTREETLPNKVRKTQKRLFLIAFAGLHSNWLRHVKSVEIQRLKHDICTVLLTAVFTLHFKYISQRASVCPEQDSSSLEEDSPSSEQTESRTALRGGSYQQQKLQKYYNKTFAPTSSPPSQRKRRGKEQVGQTDLQVMEFSDQDRKSGSWFRFSVSQFILYEHSLSGLTSCLCVFPPVCHQSAALVFPPPPI